MKFISRPPLFSFSSFLSLLSYHISNILKLKLAQRTNFVQIICIYGLDWKIANVQLLMVFVFALGNYCRALGLIKRASTPRRPCLNLFFNHALRFAKNQAFGAGFPVLNHGFSPPVRLFLQRPR